MFPRFERSLVLVRRRCSDGVPGTFPAHLTESWRRRSVRQPARRLSRCSTRISPDGPRSWR